MLKLSLTLSSGPISASATTGSSLICADTVVADRFWIFTARRVSVAMLRRPISSG
jgi:hypothetical protein